MVCIMQCVEQFQQWSLTLCEQLEYRFSPWGFFVFFCPAILSSVFAAKQGTSARE